MSIADIHARYVRERREREAQNIAEGRWACGCPIPCPRCGDEACNGHYLCC